MPRNLPSKLIVVLLSLVCLCGCWDIKEINQRSLPLAMGISKEADKKYQVTLSVPITQETGKTRIVTKKGESVSSIMGVMRTNAEDAVDYSQVRIVLVHASLASDWNKFIISFMRSKEIPSITIVAITDDPIENLFSTVSEMGYSGTALYDYFNKGSDWAPEVSIVRLWDAYQSLYSYTNDLVVPVVSQSNDTILDFKGAAVLKNGQIMYRIGPSENLLVSLFQNHNESRYTENLGIATVLVTNSSLSNKPSMNDREPRIASDLTLKISVLERNEGVSDSRIKAELKKRVEKRFNDMLTQAQKNKTDIFGFGQHFRARIPYDALKNWKERYFPQLSVKFQVHVRLE